jgi:hypothetical protein
MYICRQVWWLAVICRGTTPLHFAAAAKNNALAVCQLLLLNGADPNQAGEHHNHVGSTNSISRCHCCNLKALQHQLMCDTNAAAATAAEAYAPASKVDSMPTNVQRGSYTNGVRSPFAVCHLLLLLLLLLPVVVCRSVWLPTV